MGKIWKVTYKTVYGTQNQYSFSDVKLYYTEKDLIKNLKKLPDTTGTIEVFEADGKITIDSYLNSLKRDVQLGSLLGVAGEKSVLHSKFIEVFKNSKLDESIKNSILKDWELLPKTNDDEVKKFFAKNRNLFLLKVTDIVEWYHILLSLYNYANIGDHKEKRYGYDNNKKQYRKYYILITAVTEEQSKNYKIAKEQIKSERALAKKQTKNKK